jgi:hypothetical protein
VYSRNPWDPSGLEQKFFSLSSALLCGSRILCLCALAMPVRHNAHRYGFLAAVLK